MSVYWYIGLRNGKTAIPSRSYKYATSSEGDAEACGLFDGRNFVLCSLQGNIS